MNRQQRDFLWLSVASGLAINLVGVIRTAIGAPLELYFGLSVANIIGFRLFSGLVDIVLSFFFGLIREGMYKLGFANRSNRWHRFALDTVSISIYKSISYIGSLWLLTNISKTNFCRLVALNIFLLLVTGAFNCWYIDVLHRQLPDLTQKVLVQAKKKTIKKKPNK